MQRSREARFPWVPLESGLDGRSLVIACYPQAGAVGAQAICRETPRSIEIEVAGRAPDAPSGDVALAPRQGYVQLTVPTEAPLGGRLIRGWTPDVSRLTFGYLTVSVPAPGGLDARVPAVPRLLGLSPADALRVLCLQGFRGKILAAGREIAAQRPGRGEVPLDSRATMSDFAGTVTLLATA